MSDSSTPPRPPAATALDDCFRPGSPRLRHDEAIALLRERLAPVVGIETVDLGRLAATGGILAAPAIAARPVPAHTNSAVDGYAFAHADLSQGGADLPVIGRAAAGHPFAGPVAAGSAVRIFTGAVLPDGVDSVAMQEDCTLPAADPEHVRLPALKKGANVRRAGEDVAAGSVLLPAGHVVRPQDIAALASIGLGTVEVRRRLRLAIVSTGDEIVAPGSRPLAPGEVYDANGPMLAALARLTGAEVTVEGIWPDRRSEVIDRLAALAPQHDVVLTSGGASVGDEDHMAAALAEIGTRHLWQLAIKPGRPLMWGQIPKPPPSSAPPTVMIGLPGNPVAVFVCFLIYVYPALRRLAGAPWPEPRRLRLPAAFVLPERKTGRREFFRGTLEGAGADLRVAKYARDGSGLISGLRAADGLIEIAEDCMRVAEGDPVTFIPFDGFGILPS